jgi:hypothetical protein
MKIFYIIFGIIMLLSFIIIILTNPMVPGAREDEDGEL